MKKNNDGFYACPKCNCRIIYELDSAKVPIGILEKDPNGEVYVRTISDSGRLYSFIYKCVDCEHEFDEPLWVSAECYEGQ